MTWFMLPASIALILKIWILITSQSKPWASQNWLGFVAILAMLNLSELLIYARHSSGLALDMLLKSYYICCVLGLIFGYFYIMDGAKYSVQRHLSKVIAGAGIILMSMILLFDGVVGGHSPGSIPVIATKGQLFWLFELFVLISATLSTCVMFFNYSRAIEPIQQIAYAYTISGLAVLVISIVTIIALMMLGINANGTGIVPVATTIFILVRAQEKNTHLISKDPRRLNPLSPEASTAKLIESAQTQSALNNVGLKETIANIEAALIQYKLNRNDGNLSETARQFGVARSTLKKKLNKVAIG